VKYAATFFLLLILTSCTSFEASVAEKLSEWVAEGKIDLAQAQQILQLLSELKGQGTDWLKDLGQIGVGIVGSLFGVRMWRGGVNNRKGSTS